MSAAPRASGRALARVLDAEERGNHQHRAQAAGRLRGDQHARQLDVDRQPRHLLADRGQAALGIDRAELGQLLPAIGDGAFVGRFEEREVLDAAQAQLQHPQDHAGQARSPDLRVGEFRAGDEIGLAVQAHADAFGHAPAASLALVGAGLRDRLDVQAVEFLPRAVALDPGISRVDDVADARHRQRGFGHVGGQHDAALAAGVEDPVLVLVGQARVQRQHLGLAILAPFQRLVRVADLALAGQEYQHVAARIDPGDFIHRRHDRLVDRALAVTTAAVLVLAAAGLAFQRAVAHFHRIGTAFHADHRRIVEMAREALGVDRGRGDDQLEVGAFAQQLLEVAEQEIDVEAALVGLVDDDRVVGRQPAVAGDFRQQDAVGHELDAGVFADPVAEAHLVADHAAQRRAQFLGHPAGDRACGNSSRLGAADQAGGAAAGGQAQLWQLGGLARAGLAGNHHHRVVTDQRDDALGLARNRQLLVQGDRRPFAFAPLAFGSRRAQGLLERLLRLRVAGTGLPTRP